MKPVIIIVIAFVLLIPLSAFAQEESLSELTARLDAENIQKAQEAGSIVDSGSPSVSQQELFKKIDCPSGTYYGLDNQGNPACRDVDTNQIVDPNTGISYDSQTGEIILGEGQMGGIVIGVIFLIIIIAIAIKVASSKSKPESYKDVERKQFTPITKERVKELQHGRCAECGKIPTHWEFDHIDTRGDNTIENCQGLCLDCHQSKTREDDWRNTRE